ncbi:MAG: TlyA family rRNA (cytidine-2'-O)-methyltransferase [Candidatus Rokuibacteriota bacterium]|nr:MAG: TlyA family rRNA (cytidine-2'-O)-methyltransferase [Candidatus Rokubacteria bacterium]
MDAKRRIDQLLVERGLAESREKAARLILAGEVLVDGRRVDKAGALVSTEAEIDVRGGAPYVSRGGEKLAHALDYFKIDVRGKTCADIGASTGGFTDCLLQRGAAKVFAIDVGTGQLDPKLRKDPRVVVMEQINARILDPRLFSEAPEVAVVDVSFISLEKVLPPVFASVAPAGLLIALVKPQFELGKGAVGKGGVVRDPVQHQAVVARLARFSVLRGWHVLGVTASPLKGAKGNREFFLHLSLHGRTPSNLEGLIARSVEAFA